MEQLLFLHQNDLPELCKSAGLMKFWQVFLPDEHAQRPSAKTVHSSMTVRQVWRHAKCPVSVVYTALSQTLWVGHECLSCHIPIWPTHILILSSGLILECAWIEWTSTQLNLLTHDHHCKLCNVMSAVQKWMEHSSSDRVNTAVHNVKKLSIIVGRCTRSNCRRAL